MRMNEHWSLRARGAVTAHLGINGLLASARAGLDRLESARARHTLAGGAILIDTRPEFQRRADGEIPGAIVIERNHLEWRCDPASPARIPEATGYQVTWIICCDEGYSSSLAAASLQALGLSNATDLIGGFQALARGRASGVQNTGADQATADLTLPMTTERLKGQDRRGHPDPGPGHAAVAARAVPAPGRNSRLPCDRYERQRHRLAGDSCCMLPRQATIPHP
jgi:rhodanese-related sulfurtransferase